MYNIKTKNALLPHEVCKYCAESYSGFAVTWILKRINELGSRWVCAIQAWICKCSAAPGCMTQKPK